MIYTLRFDQSAIAIIGEALGAMPHRQVATLIGNIQQQINAQEAAASSGAARSAGSGSEDGVGADEGAAGEGVLERRR
jgi:hypothetical protein